MNDTNTPAKFIIIDGIDGSGKSTIIDTWKTALTAQGKRIFSLKQYTQEHNAYPRVEELLEYDIIFSAEPTYIWTGAAIRQELIHTDSSYSAHTIASAYALDRHILYTRVLLPLLTAGKTIIQDRGVSTSLCYQSIDNTLSLADIATLEGNTFALKHAPNVLFLTNIDPSIALERIQSRSDKQDNALFEKKLFLEKAAEQFANPAYQAYFTTRGTDVQQINTGLPLPVMQSSALAALSSVLNISL